MTRPLNRRRFMMLTAAALCPLATASHAAEWQGFGLGAELSLRLIGGTPAQTRHAFRKVEVEIARIEAMASLHRDSSLTRLNRDGRLTHPEVDFLRLLALAGQVHAATGGAFDPTVQPLYLALASGADPAPARRLIGWPRVTVTATEIRLAAGQALTLNGIAQGWAADRIAEIITSDGFGNALINMGEIQTLGTRADGQPWRAEITSPKGAALADLPLSNRALATSSPRGTLIGPGLAHILGPMGQAPRWQTVAVSAPQAALADALSTGFCLMDRAAIDQALRAFPAARLEALA